MFFLTLAILYFMVTKNSISMSLTLIFITLYTVKNLFTLFNWSAYIIFLVFMGGVMILFMYIISLMKNEKLNNKILLALILFIPETSKFHSLFFIEKIFMPYSKFLTFLSILYLFLILMMTIKIIYLNKSPLRKLN